MIAPARVAALRAIRAVTKGQADLAAALHRVRPDVPDRRDRALANEIVAGTLRWQGALDHLVQYFAQRPLSKFDPVVLDVLRLSVYQLIHLDRVPPSAVVSDAVDLTRSAGKRSAAGLTNAVLRAVLRAGPSLPLPAPPARDAIADVAHLPFGQWSSSLKQDTLRFLSITQSHPAWLVERWLGRYGYADTLAWTTFNNQPAPMTVLVNTLRTTVEAATLALHDRGIAVRPCLFAPQGLVVEHGNPLLTDLWERGHVLVQDEASQLIAPLIRAVPGERLLDACAAPGGKTVALAAGLATHGLLVAGDLRSSRLALLSETLIRCGAAAALVAHDLAVGSPFGRAFDAVLVDAPCTGLGTLRRDPEIRWRRQPGDLERLARLQTKMLRSAGAMVRPGGRLLYATCSSEPDENERVAEAFLSAEPDFRQAPLPVAESLRPTARDTVLSEAGHLRTYPYRHALDAFFAAAFRRR